MYQAVAVYTRSVGGKAQLGDARGLAAMGLCMEGHHDGTEPFAP
jgi:hypothetical protein